MIIYMYKINWVEVVKTKSGKEYKKAELESGEEVSVWPDFSGYNEVMTKRLS